MGLELLDKGLEFSDSWLLHADSSAHSPNSFLRLYRGSLLNPVVNLGYIYYYISIVTYLVRFRLVDEVLDGLTTDILVTMLARSAVWSAQQSGSS